MKKVMLILVVMLLWLCGCNETQQVPANTKPLSENILPMPDNWAEAYGSTPETQLFYNAATGLKDDRTLQRAIMIVAATIQKTHASDPNEIRWRGSVEERLKCLEEDTIKIYTPIEDIDPRISDFITVPESIEGQVRWIKDDNPWWRPWRYFQENGHLELYDGSEWKLIEDYQVND